MLNRNAHIAKEYKLAVISLPDEKPFVIIVPAIFLDGINASAYHQYELQVTKYRKSLWE